VFGLYGGQITGSLKRAGFFVSQLLMAEGERHKSFASLAAAVEFLAANSLEREDAVLALGGGVVGDLAGFSAAVYLRGISFIQVPTTLLAQIDASVGGKTAINLAFGKNLVGAFHQPRCVVIDPATLVTLPKRELTAGFCEMVKQGLVADTKLFHQTKALLQHASENPSTFLRSSGFEKLIAAHCKFKASIVADDERESTTRSDAKSRKVLNFGHTTAHALESLTNYRTFRHGEAVGYGVLVAVQISKHLGLLGETEVEEVRDAVALCGRLPAADRLDVNAIIGLLKHDKKRMNGEISWVLLEGIGSPKIIKGAEISSTLLRESLREGLQKPGPKKVYFNQ
jgi:3-dehydroquinate synthase